VLFLSLRRWSAFVERTWEETQEEVRELWEVAELGKKEDAKGREKRRRERRRRKRSLDVRL